MKRTARLLSVFTLLQAIFFASSSSAGLVNYSQDFESLNQSDPSALGNDGWLVYGNVFDSTGSTFFYPYGPFPAPNNFVDPAFSLIASGAGGPSQGINQLVVFSDYKNSDHGNGFLIESNVFQEQTVGPADIGKTFHFEFDAKLGDISGASTAAAFIKTVDLLAGTSLTNFITLDTTNLPSAWGSFTLSLVIDPSLDGQKLQFGFLNTASNYQPSGVFYDNINAFVAQVPAPVTLALLGIGLAGIGYQRRKLVKAA